MKSCASFWLSVLVLTAALAGCKNERQVDAAKPLEQSFQAAEPELKKTVAQATAHLRSGNYTEATRALVPVLSRGLNAEQKQALGLALKQINDAVAANPALDTQEMYELRAKMFHAVHSGPRF